MSWSRSAALALLSLTVPPTTAFPRAEAIPRGESTVSGPLGATWEKRSVEVQAFRVRLTGLGARTHANWTLFRLPFSSLQRDRVRSVRFTPHLRTRGDVGALRIGSVCVEFPSRGGIETWSLYTMSGIGRTERFVWHPLAPTDDPTVLGINVPTRVANYAACGWDEGRLWNPEEWSLTVEWEQR